VVSHHRLLLVLSLLSSLVIAACEGVVGGDVVDAGPEPLECFFGDETQPPTGELVFLDENFQMQDLVSGQAVPVLLPPQGGKVAFIGVRLKNMDLCSLQATGGVFDDCPSEPRVIGRESRGIEMEKNDATGLAEPADPTTINNYVNIPLCGNFTSSRDIDGEPYRVELRVSDRARRALVLRADITPFCPGAATDDDGVFAQCLCECDADYDFAIACEEVVVDDDAAPGTCPATAPGAPPPVCVPACDPARVCAPTEIAGVGVCR
jgi:hypothetical protein